MIKKRLSLMLVVLSCCALAHAKAEGTANILQNVPLSQVSIDDPFWSPKMKVWREVTIPDSLTKFEQDGTLDNFDHVAKGELAAKHGGAPWFDGLIYEMIRASADFMVSQPDAKLEARIDGYIDRIEAASKIDPDGYLNTYTQMKEPTHRWGTNGGNDLFQHDVYNAGCLVDAGVHYYRATGKTKLLNVAVRMANLMCKTMGPPPRQNIIPGHAISEEAFVGLYLLCKEEPDLKSKLSAPLDEKQYLELAQFWIDARGHHEGRTNFNAYDQDEVPVSQLDSMVGHAVRAALLTSGITATAGPANRTDYAQLSRKLWENMIAKQLYITGTIGSFAGEEKFGPDYVLPNNCYGETCAAVANGFYSQNINLLTGEASAVDELERTLYNGTLAGVSLAGNTYFYENPLESGKNRVRWKWHGCPCCPPMFLKIMAALPSYIYSTDSANAAYVNLFVSSTAKLDNMTLTQKTTYPWSGNVQITVNSPKPTATDVNVRVPGWSLGGATPGGLYSTARVDAFTVKINGELVKKVNISSGYVHLHRAWKDGDLIEVQINMPIQRIKANDQVEADRGKVAIARGPLVYCLESIDAGDHVRDIYLPEDAVITQQEKPELLNGVMTLRITAKRLQADGQPVDADITAIPYYANANRGPVSMITWIPTSADGAMKPTISALATPTASHVNPTDSLAGMAEEYEPKSSHDESHPRFSWWDHKGRAEWAQYKFDQVRKVSSVDIYWYSDDPTGGCRVPESWSLQFRDGNGEWKPVTTQEAFATKADTYNTVHFDPVESTALRVHVQLQKDFTAGILQWRVH